MADIIDLNGARVSSNRPVVTPEGAPQRTAHNWAITQKDGRVVVVNGLMYITPLFIAVGEQDAADFLYLCPFDNLNNFMDADTSEPESPAAA